jgi:hypothetical protein
MSNDQWNRFSEPEQETAAAAFAALSLRDSLTRDPEVGATPRFGISDLHAYVNDPDHSPQAGLDEALERDERLRNNLESLLSRRALCRFELARVASTGGVSHRQEGLYSISIQESLAMTGRSIVVIELAEDAPAPPQTIFAQSPEGPCHKLRLPEAENGRIQLLVEQESAFVSAFSDPNARVYLR